jgi:hypothetical protein
MFAYMRDCLGNGNDPFPALWEALLDGDHFYRVKTTDARSQPVFEPADCLFSFGFHVLGGLIRAVNNFYGRRLGELQPEESAQHPFRQVLSLSYAGLTEGEKTTVRALGSLHHSGIVLPLLLVTGEIDPLTYCYGLVALKIQPADRLGDIQADILHVLSFLAVLKQNPGPDYDINEIVAQGERDALEFKSTLRWDIRAGKASQAIERACLKTISAFLNTGGGMLLIGVRDDGSIEGIETDHFPNEDKFLLHLWTLIRTCLGKQFSPYIQTTLVKTGEKTVCVVACKSSRSPVFLRQPGFEEEMFLRTGPASNALYISEALKYIEEHFGTGSSDGDLT